MGQSLTDMVEDNDLRDVYEALCHVYQYSALLEKAQTEADPSCLCHI